MAINFLKILVPESVVNKIRAMKSRYLKSTIVKKWQSDGNPFPTPHEVKQVSINIIQKKYKCKILVETGTFKGDMIEAQRRYFEKVISIELADFFYQKAVQRFKRCKNVQLYKGDSGILLNEIMPLLTERTLFWLDGHYSGGFTAKGTIECPVLDELKAIFAKNELKHVILIDDARCFDGTNDYPTIEELTFFLKQYSSDYEMQNNNDIIYLLPLPK